MNRQEEIKKTNSDNQQAQAKNPRVADVIERIELEKQRKQNGD